MQTPTIKVSDNRRFVALVTQVSRPAHSYTYGASRPSLRPVIGGAR